MYNDTVDHNGFVYLWKNLINGKVYIGSHWGNESDGYLGSGVLFKKAVEKYGIDNFTRFILELKQYNSERELRQSEHFFLKSLQVVDKDVYYNLTDNAGCSKRSLESRLKQSATMTGRKQSAETIAKRVQNNPGNSKGLYITPNGTFNSSVEAAKYNNCSYRTILNKCKMNKNGWYFQPKESQ
jgi:hypothetical protein